VFHVLKCRFGFTKVRSRGLEKNAKHLFAALSLVNLVMAKRRLLQT
jgi:IS5 family transposase